MSFVRKSLGGVIQDTGNNLADFTLVSGNERIFGSQDGKITAELGVPAPQNSHSLSLKPTAISVQILNTVNGSEEYDPTPVVNGRLGTYTLYRRITNTGTSPILHLRFRINDITAGGTMRPILGGRPDVRALSSADTTVSTGSQPSATVRGLALEEFPTQTFGGAINSSLNINAITPDSPLMPGQTVYVGFKLGIERWGRYKFSVVPEELR